ncbi:ESX secretion-associated protein EspG [Crossiella sp. SN42]|uniref:ESX secretion-associated protein EspG n=1 Tax=Crossiella sp. SN42 TaxID=2944808 RepID=UPI00207D1122|nr:ESX secretion-associated protein EspG [Crossiella sp. SN42]MCO1581074.1 ESX secretion-associated protein EspG [Crossiella sp. SN42]
MTLFEQGLREPIALTALEFDVLWQHLGLGQPPLVIKVPSPGRTHTERAGLERQAWDALEARGLGRPVAVDEELAALLRLLADPAREVDGRLWLGRSVRVLAAAREEEGALAVLDSGQLTVKAISGLSLPREAVGVLRPLPAGPGRSVTLPSAELDAAAAAAGNSADRLGPELVERGIRQEDAKVITEMIKDAGDLGQFGVAAKEQWERRRRADRVIGFFDTPAGRYLQTRRGVDGGAAWSTIAPVDNRRLTQHLEEVLADLLAG